MPQIGRHYGQPHDGFAEVPAGVWNHTGETQTATGTVRARTLCLQTFHLGTYKRFTIPSATFLRHLHRLPRIDSTMPGLLTTIHPNKIPLHMYTMTSQCFLFPSLTASQIPWASFRYGNPANIQSS
ncbi:hypothetical protein AG1IA_00567 [Rhizoctonia solani AG-1 IA]|uniref:Uncharacterized protein n=1 Tax=Thanatephorus cucumeris (strain AG1-IA) TaxID=983506 RepID=L8X515_THACA|nr:hypothetical protein AG1IA_00567 [Rhizoctonia solani AG-1 IA]